MRPQQSEFIKSRGFLPKLVQVQNCLFVLSYSGSKERRELCTEKLQHWKTYT